MPTLDSEAAGAFVALLGRHLHAGGVAVVATHQPIEPALRADDGAGRTAQVRSLKLGEYG